jgi:uncharacterized protein with ACT and thioredoxin-like domain
LTVKINEQISEIVKHSKDIQDRQTVIDLKLEELNQLDIVKLLDEVSEIRKAESENQVFNKKWMVISLGALGACIVIGIAILIKVHL